VTPHADDARVVVYSREGCHLCATAEEQVAAICAETGDTWVRVDIAADPELQERFTEQVPVTFVDGSQHDFWRVDPDRLRKALGRRRRLFGRS
jgi:glutaredoxin